jgi:hypothetical protein
LKKIKPEALGEYTFRRKEKKDRQSAPLPDEIRPALSRFQLEVEELFMEWVVTCPAQVTIKDYLVNKKQIHINMYEKIIRYMPVEQWIKRRTELGQRAGGIVLRQHVEYLAEMNDTHIKTAKIGILKAMEFMTKMQIETYRGKDGRVKYKGFTPSDLKDCIMTIAAAQKIQRMALGLPNDEGSVVLWQNITQQTTNVGEGGQAVVVQGEAIREIEKTLSMEDIRALTAHYREQKRLGEAKNAQSGISE